MPIEPFDNVALTVTPRPRDPRQWVFFLCDKPNGGRYTDTPLTEDRATLESDPSAVRTSEHGAVKFTALLYLLSCSETKAINPSPPPAGCS